MNIVENAGSALRYTFEIGKRMLSNTNNKNANLVSYTKAARVEPITMIDNRLQTLPYLSDVLQTMSSIMAAYFVQAVSLTTHVKDVNVLGTLDKLNPQRDVNRALINDLNSRFKLSKESYVRATLEHHGLGLEDDQEDEAAKREQALFERIENEEYERALRNKVRREYERQQQKEEENDRIKKNGGVSLAVGSDSLKSSTIHENVNLAVGKVIQVQVGDAQNGAVFPISIRLLSNLMDPNVLVHILSDGSRNVTLRERWHGWRSGELQFWRDLVLCTDLVDEHRRALAKDNTGVYAAIMDRRRKNALTAAITETPSIGTASNMLVVSKRLIQEFERQVGGSWNSLRTRNKVFESTYLMVIAVVDPDREMVYFYHRGIELPSQLSIREIKVSNGKGGPDIMEIMDSLLKARTPSF